MKIAFLGTVESSYVALSSICAFGYVPYVVATMPPSLAYKHPDFSDLAPLTMRYNIPLHYTTNCNSAGTMKVLKTLQPDLVLVIGWSQICSAAFRSIPKIGCIGFHPSALPKFRGRGAIPETIMRCERDVGTSIHWLAAGTNDGPIAALSRYSISPEKVTAQELHDRSMQALVELLPQLVNQIEAGDIPAEPQPIVGASICKKRATEDCFIDWTRPALEVDRLIRAVGPPFPGAYTLSPDGRKLVVTAARKVHIDGKQTGVPGQVQAVTEQSFYVLCGDGNSLLITEWSGSKTPPTLNSTLGLSRKSALRP